MADSYTNNHVTNSSSDSSTVLSFAKIFGYVGLGLLITAAVAVGLGILFTNLKAAGSFSEPMMLGIMLGCCVLQIILSFVVQFVFLKGEHSIALPAIIYCITMGLMLSSFVFVGIDWSVLSLAFGITAGTFFLMALIALFTRNSSNAILPLVSGLFIGAGILALVNIFMRSSQLYWIISFAVFAVLLFVTMFDLYNIKTIVDAGIMNRNLALYCAFKIYVDFIAIFVRLVYYLSLITRKR